MKVREPVARPLDVVAVELLLSASQAFLVGVLMYLAVGIWDDRGVGFGPVATILGLLGLAIGGSWLYWLFGGVGWPLAAAGTPAAMFLGFALVLGWFGEDLFRVPGVPLLLATASAAYGIIGGVFIDSPRRWRWDQRQKLRPGTRVPRVSPTARSIVSQLPRSLPRRSVASTPVSDLASRIEHSNPLGQPQPGAPGGGDADAGPPAPAGGPPSSEAGASDSPPGTSEAATVGGKTTGLSEADEDATAHDAPTGVARPAVSHLTARTGGGQQPVAIGPARAADDKGAIELPTSIEPRAQRSPWAWAAPPDWTRDEDDEAPAAGSAKRS